MENKEYEMIAYEGFIRRASEINYPFMLKGSYVTRQYFPNPKDRIPADLDWVYLEKIDNVDIARNIFDEWLLTITEAKMDDGVEFRSFKENQFWRMIDYAMADDFPTVNTDVKCWVNGLELDFQLDISFNLPIEQPPVSLIYNPLKGEPFIVPNTAPISLQVAWKIHQTLVRPRFKDLFDLMFLVQHADFDDNNRYYALQALLNECIADKLTMNKLHDFFSYNFEKLFDKNFMNKTWDYWRHEKSYFNMPYYDNGKEITDVSKLPSDMKSFLILFIKIMEKAGLGIQVMDILSKMPNAHKITPISKQIAQKISENILIDKIKGIFKK